MKLWSIERRILSYLDQRGPMHRSTIVADLSGPDSRIGKGILNGSNSRVPQLMAAWSRRLVKQGAVKIRKHDGFYQHHAITDIGRKMLRSDAA